MRHFKRLRGFDHCSNFALSTKIGGSICFLLCSEFELQCRYFCDYVFQGMLDRISEVNRLRMWLWWILEHESSGVFRSCVITWISALHHHSCHESYHSLVIYLHKIEREIGISTSRSHLLQQRCCDRKRG